MIKKRYTKHVINYGTKGMAPIACATWMLVEASCVHHERQKPDLPTNGVLVVTREETPSTKTEVKPTNMQEVEDAFCPVVEQICLQWVDALGHPTEAPGVGLTGRCGEFKNPTVCLTPEAKRPLKHFFIDTYEYPNVRGDVPRSWMTWREAQRACEAIGKRLCTRSEWTMACEGPGLHPYPYGDGYHRDRTSCNTDNPSNGIDVFKATSLTTETARKLDAMLMPAGSMPGCVSIFGVFDMVGNIDEEVVNETGRPYKSGLMGGHVFGVRNACRPMTEAHNEDFGWYETCKDVEKNL